MSQCSNFIDSLYRKTMAEKSAISKAQAKIRKVLKKYDLPFEYTIKSNKYYHDQLQLTVKDKSKWFNPHTEEINRLEQIMAENFEEQTKHFGGTLTDTFYVVDNFKVWIY